MELIGLSKEIFFSRYAYPGDKNWNDRAATIAKTASLAEDDLNKENVEKDFYKILESGDFIPGGRIIFGAGRPKFNMLNCYVLWPNDSIESIGQVIKDAYMISCGGGGIGFDFSRIRPRGDDIQNIKNSAPGSVSVMNMINEIGEHVRSGKNRRTALMGILRCDHPDLLDFLEAKLSKKALNNFNISVAITNNFIKAVEKNQLWSFSFNNKQYYLYEVLGNDKKKEIKVNVTALSIEDAINRANNFLKPTFTTIFNQAIKINITAKEIWDKLFKSAVECGDPGIYNVDLANQYTNVGYFEHMPSTNPCLSKGSLVLTPNGYKKVEDFKVGDEVITVEGIGRPIKEIEKHSNLPVYKVQFSDGSEQICTAAHQFYAVKGTGQNQFWKHIPLKDLEEGDTIRVAVSNIIPNNPVNDKPAGISDREYGFIIGTCLGDGCWTDKSKCLKIASNIDEKDWNDVINSIIPYDSVSHHYDSRGRQTKAISLIYNTNSKGINIVRNSKLPRFKSIDKYIPIDYINSNKEFLQGLLDGLFSTDGTVNCKGALPHIRFTSGSKKLATDVKGILSFFGIHGRMYEQERKEHEYDGRRIKSNAPKYDVWINSSDIIKFYTNIKLSHPNKQELIKKCVIFGKLGTNTRRTQITKIEYAGLSDVYDLYEPETDTWISEGIVSRGCGEIPIPEYGNCDLGHINLSNMVDMNGNVNWKKMAFTIRLAVRFLDNILTINNFAVPECKEVGHRSRRIGVGVTGLHYLLIKSGYKYGDETCCEFIERLFQTIRDEAYKASINLAKEKGAFPVFNSEKYLNEGFAKTLPPRIRRDIKKYGIRNAVMLTCAPCGTNSMVLGVSTGIEPIFAPIYERSYLENNVWKKQLVVDPLFKKLYESNDKRMDLCVGAYDITPEEHIKIQASIQKYIDQALSKTCNLPEDTTYEDVKDIILDYAHDVKGFTIYRSGSRGTEPLKAILISKLKKNEIDKLMSESVNYGVEESSSSICNIKGGSCE